MDWTSVTEWTPLSVTLLLLVWLMVKHMPEREKDFRESLEKQREQFRTEVSLERDHRESMRDAYRAELNTEREAHNAETQGLVAAINEVRTGLGEVTSVLKGMNGRWDGKTERRNP